jgi:FtsH-binding integral membrane protein
VAESQLLSVPPFAIACAFTLAVGIFSDKKRVRGPIIVTWLLIAIVGFSLAISTKSPAPGYTAACLAATGVFPMTAVLFAWIAGNTPDDLKRGAVIAFVMMIGNVGGWVQTQLFIAL